jgi:gas vesicle protein
MGEDPSAIRAEIEETRARVGDEVDALSYKTDVSARAGDYVDEKKQAVKDKVTGVKDAVTGTMSSATNAVTGTASKAVPSGEQMGRLRDTAKRNPLGLGVAAAAVGFVAGLLLPSTRVENEQMGEMSDRLVDAAKETASDAVERGKQVAQETAETAKEAGKEQGQELASNLQQRTQEASSGSESPRPAA